MIAPRRRLSRMLFALALGLAQQVLVAHLLAHALSRGSADDPFTPAERAACVLCIAGFASGAALPTNPPPLLAMPARVLQSTPLTWEYLPPVTLAFSSRAPPHLL